jgi:hypothetical protein
MRPVSAAIPAMIILFVIGLLLVVFLGGLITGEGHFTMRHSTPLNQRLL